MPDVAIEIAVLPAGTFLLGCPEEDAGRRTVQGPQQRITLERAFGIGKLAVTVVQFAAFVIETRHPMGSACGQWEEADWLVPYPCWASRAALRRAKSSPAW